MNLRPAVQFLRSDVIAYDSARTVSICVAGCL